MKPTTGNWAYNEDFSEVQYLALPLAQVCWGEDTGAEHEVEMHANGYLMAAAPNLRDELTDLSRAVRDLLLVSNDPIASAEEAQRCWDTVENMCQRAERALATIFPPEPVAE